jgi:H+/Cl- antiporter ClcA
VADTDVDKGNVYLERYKYVLKQKQFLNDTTFKITTIYQAGLAVLVAGQYAVVATAKSSPNFDRDVARAGSEILLGLMIVLSVFTLFLLGSGAAAWQSYDKEEKEFEKDVFVREQSEQNIKRVFRWYETYIAVAVIVILFIYALVVYLEVLPSMG